MIPEHLGRTGLNNFSSIDIPILYEFGKNKVVLDIGCANGDLVKHCNFYCNSEAYGIDGDYYAINFYSDTAIRKNLICHDYTNGRSNFNKKVDLVISIDFLEHVEEKYIDNYMKDFSLGKLIIIHTPPKGTKGWHHVNTNDKYYWIETFKKYNLIFDEKLTDLVRNISEYYNPRDMMYIEKNMMIHPKNNYLVFNNNE